MALVTRRTNLTAIITPTKSCLEPRVDSLRTGIFPRRGLFETRITSPIAAFFAWAETVGAKV